MNQIELHAGRTDLAIWADDARLVHAMAQSLATTSFVPKSMQGKPDEVTGAILAGRELGLSPMAALRTVDIIDGTPAMRALALRGLVQAHGHDVWVEESSDIRAEVCGRRKGSAQTQRSVWTIERARKANLAGKRNWTLNPAAMLIARATAEVCRLIAADVLIGMPYAFEEIADEANITIVADTAPKKAKEQRAVKRELPEPPPVPELEAAPVAAPYRERIAAEEGPPIEEYEPPENEKIGPVMRAKLMAAYNKAGITMREPRLAHAATVLGRDVASANDLTVGEARKLIADLDAMPKAAKTTRDDDWPDVAVPPEEA